jgi:hypothetical protein
MAEEISFTVDAKTSMARNGYKANSVSPSFGKNTARILTLRDQCSHTFGPLVYSGNGDQNPVTLLYTHLSRHFCHCFLIGIDINSIFTHHECWRLSSSRHNQL